MRKDVLEVIGSAAYQPDTESMWWSSSSEPIKATLIASPIRPDDVAVCVGESIRAGWLSIVPSWTPLGMSSAWLAEHITTVHSTSRTNKRNDVRWYRTNKKLWSGTMLFTSHLYLLLGHDCQFTRRRDRNEPWGSDSRLATWEEVAIYAAMLTSCNDADVDHLSYSRSFPVVILEKLAIYTTQSLENASNALSTKIFSFDIRIRSWCGTKKSSARSMLPWLLVALGVIHWEGVIFINGQQK